MTEETPRRRRLLVGEVIGEGDTYRQLQSSMPRIPVGAPHFPVNAEMLGKDPSRWPHIEFFRVMTSAEIEAERAASDARDAEARERSKFWEESEAIDDCSGCGKSVESDDEYICISCTSFDGLEWSTWHADCFSQIWDATYSHRGT